MSSVRKNFAYQSLYQATTMLLPLITSPYLARVLGANQIGIYSYTYAVAFYFSMFALLGIGNYGNKAIASVRDFPEKLNVVFSSLLIAHLFFGVVASLLYYVYVFSVESELKSIMLIQGLWVVGALFDISWFFFGIEFFRLTVIRSMVVKILMTVLLFVFVREKNDVGVYCLIMSLGTLVSQLLLWPFLRGKVKFVPVKTCDVLQHVKPMMILFVPVVAISLYRYMDKILLGILSTKEHVGYFENAEKAMNIPISIVNSFGLVMLPRMANLFSKGSDEECLATVEKSMEFILCLACAMAFGMAAIAKRFSIVFWGGEFAECGILLQILCISIFFMTIANVVRTQYLIPKGKNWPYVVSVCIGAVVNLVANFFLIPRYNSAGTAFALVMAEISVCVAQLYFIRKDFPVTSFFRKSYFFLFWGMVMFAALYAIDFFFSSNMIALIVQLVVGVALYLIGCFAYFKKQKNAYFENFVTRFFSKIKVLQ